MAPRELHTAFRPDPWPYNFLVYRELRDGRTQVAGFLASPVLNWRAAQQNQQVSRLQTGDRKIHDMSLLNLQTWDRLSDGGVGARETTDATRYRWAENVMAGDQGEIKLSPVSYILDNFADAHADERIVDMLIWPGPKVSNRAAGQGDEMLTVILSSKTLNQTRIVRVTPTNEGATLTYEATIAGMCAAYACIHKNVLYLSVDLAGVTTTMQSVPYALRWFKWNGSAWQSGNVTDNWIAERLYSDGKHLYRSVGAEVYRSLDPVMATPTPPATIWEGPAQVGNGPPVTGLLTYGTDEGVAVYATTWAGLYRSLEEDGKIVRFSPVDVRAGAYDDKLGVALDIVNSEIVYNYARGLLRHSLGTTQGTSPWQDDGVPYDQRGIFTALEDGVGGIYCACNPIVEAGKPTIYRWQDGRWHTFLVYQSSTFEEITHLLWTSRQMAETARLWSVVKVEGKTRLCWLPMPTSAHNYRHLTQTQYPPEGEITLPWFTSEFAKLDKSWLGLTADMVGGVAAAGSVEFYAAERIDQLDVEYTYVGAYTPVPRTTFNGAPVDWRPAQDGAGIVDRLRINQQTDGIGLKLKLRRGLGAAYADTGLVNVRATTIWDGRIVAWGQATTGDVRPYADERVACDYGLMVWGVNGWERLDLDCAYIAGVVQDGTASPLVFGDFLAPDGLRYGVATWDTITNTFTFDMPGFAARFAGREASYFWMVGENGGQWFMLRSDGTPWELVVQYNGAVSFAKGDGAGGGVLSTGSFTNFQGLTVTNAAAWINITSLAKTNVIFPGLTDAEVRQTWDLLHYSETMYIAQGTSSSTGVHSFPRANLAAGGAVAWSVVNTSNAYGAYVTALSMAANGNLRFGMSKGHILELIAGVMTLALLPSANTAAVRGFFGPGSHWFYGDFNQTVNSRDIRLAGQQIFSRYHAAQLVYLPAFVTAVESPTPVIGRVGLWYFEWSPKLDQYTFILELSDRQRLLDTSENPLSADQQLDVLLKLADTNELMTFVMPDRRILRGWIDGVSYSLMSDDRTQVKAPRDWKYNVTLTITEAEPSTDRPVPYYLPGIKSG